MKGVKYDEGKLQLNLIPPETIEGLGRVLTYGANKYCENGWQGVEQERYVAALLRHFTAWRKGEERDEESGLLHLEHMLANIAFIHWKELNRKV